jgi:predicted Zn-ribbon and HTH transcriptional regulator
MKLFKNKEKIVLTLEQYICEECGCKFYINSEDDNGNELSCPKCKNISINKRKFGIEIISIVERGK